MRRAPLLLSVLLACSVSKSDTGDDATTAGDDTSFTSTIGMSSAPSGTSDPSLPTLPPTSVTLEPDPSMVTLEPTTDVLTTGQTSEPPGPDLPTGSSSGVYLLAVSTIVSPDLPFQFLTTVDASDPSLWTFVFQPLSLDGGQTDSPRLPVGDPFVFTDVPVMNGQFTLDFGELLLAGATNPITSSDITATILLAGQVQDADAFCGDVSGMVTAPLMTTIDGSSFAAVRVAGLDDLPDAITIDCDGATVMTP
jgi:hypothetical protein